MKFFALVAILFLQAADASAETPPPTPFAEQANQQGAPAAENPSRLNSIELAYRLFSTEILFQLGNDSVVMIPKNAGQPGIRFTNRNLSFSFNKSLFSESSQASGLDIAYSWERSFVQAYHVWARGYRVQLNPNSNMKNLGDRDNMTGTSDGLLFLKAFDESFSFSMMTDRGPRDQQSLETPLRYLYQILIDRTRFEDSNEFVAGGLVRGKERTSLLPGLGARMSQSTPVASMLHR